MQNTGASPIDQSRETVLRVPEHDTKTLTLVFSDLEGSTRLLDVLGSAYANVLEEIRSIIRGQLRRHAGREIDTAGDGMFVCFTSAIAAVSATVEIQRAITQNIWPDGARILLRIGIHTGEPVRQGDDLVGMDVHRAARICSAAHGGQILISSASRSLLPEPVGDGIECVELGDFRLKDIPIPERLFQVMAAGMPAHIRRPRAESVGGELPVSSSELVGRTAELLAITGLLESGERLVTLTGPGGIGKTRLAIEAARQASSSFESGARFVSLAAVFDPAELYAAVARQLGVHETADGNSRDTLLHFLKSRPMLLVLDNFEQLIDAAPQLADLLAAAHQVSVLATSRIAFRIRGEREFRVPTLAFPNGSSESERHEPGAYPAVQLFVDRARALKPDFTLEGNEEAVAMICARVDGLPLAIELAAARSRLFTPVQLLNRLSRSLDVLEAKARDVPERHQTLRGAIAWSYDLLAETEKAVFRQLAVFSRGFTVEAASRVCVVAGGVAEVENCLDSLLERSLIRENNEAAGESRFGMLELIREYAEEALRSSGEEEKIRHRHAVYYAEIAEGAEPLLTGPEQDEWLDRLEAEHENFSAALRWCTDNGAVSTGLSIGSSLWRYWTVRGYMIQGRNWLGRLLELSAPQEVTVERARALNALGTIFHEIGDYAEAEALLDECLAIFRDLDDDVGAALVLNNLGWVACEVGHHDKARRLSRQALELYRNLDDPRGQSLALNNIGWSCVYESRLPEALALHLASAQLRREAGDERGLAYSYVNIGWVYRLLGRHDDALERIDAALQKFKRLKDVQLQGFCMGMRGHVLWDCGQWPGAADHFRESLRFWEQTGNKWGMGWAQCTLALVLLDLEQFEEALKNAEAGLSMCVSTIGGYPVALGHHTMASVSAATGNVSNAIGSFRTSIEKRMDIADGLGLADSMEAMVRWLVPSDDRKTATELAAAALTIRREAGGPVPPRTIPVYARLSVDTGVTVNDGVLEAEPDERLLELAVRDSEPLSSMRPAADAALRYLGRLEHPHSDT